MKRWTRLSLFLALALIIFVIELQIPNPFPIPGVKLGLANIITVYALYEFSLSDVLILVVCRVCLGSLLSGHLEALPYSLAGSMFCMVGMIVVKKFVSKDYLWFSSVIGAICHNVGQLCVAYFILESVSVWMYGPFLLVSACLTGLLTGITAQIIIHRIGDKYE